MNIGDMIAKLLMGQQMQDPQAMSRQMGQAQNIADQVRGSYELPIEYRPPQYWDYGQPVRMG